MEIVIKGDLLDFVDEYELREDVKCQIRRQIENIFTSDSEVKSAVISTILKQVEDMKFTKEVEEKLKERFEKIVRKDYLEEEADWNIKYDTGMRDKVKELFDKNYDSQYASILKKSIDKQVNEYQLDNSTIADAAVELLLKDEKCVQILQESLQERIYDLLEKI